MKALTLPLIAASMAALPMTPAMAQAPTGAPMSVQAPLLSFSVTEEVRAAPDEASVSAGVTTTASTAVEAMQANAAAMTKLIAAAKAQGIKDEDIQTSGIGLSPQYDYSERTPGQPPRFIGYQVTNSVRATTNKIDEIGPLLDALVAAGGTNIGGPWFAMEDPDAMLVGARGAAIKAAEAKAQDYARLAGFSGAVLVSISEGSFASPPMPMPKMARAYAAEADASTPVEPGQVGNSLTLNFQYRLVK